MDYVQQYGYYHNTDITNMKVVTRTSQQPTATSFDSNADLLIAKSISLESQPTELQMSFGRAVAIGKMTVKNSHRRSLSLASNSRLQIRRSRAVAMSI